MFQLKSNLFKSKSDLIIKTRLLYHLLQTGIRYPGIRAEYENGTKMNRSLVFDNQNTSLNTPEEGEDSIERGYPVQNRKPKLYYGDINRHICFLIF